MTSNARVIPLGEDDLKVEEFKHAEFSNGGYNRKLSNNSKNYGDF
jgi:hypothetical protein